MEIDKIRLKGTFFVEEEVVRPPTLVNPICTLGFGRDKKVRKKKREKRRRQKIKDKKGRKKNIQKGKKVKKGHKNMYIKTKKIRGGHTSVSTTHQLLITE